MKNINSKHLLASVLMLCGIGQSTKANLGPPRGQFILPYASNCQMGPFPQTAKAGEYNQLCHIMQDSEKCLAFIKGHFRQDGETVIVNKTHSPEKAAFCLSALKHDLLGTDEE